MGGALLAVLLLGACEGDLFGPDPVPTAIPELGGDALIWLAPTTTAPAPPPAWSPLPDPGGLPADRRQALVDRLCEGSDGALVAELEAALAREVQDPDPSDPWTGALFEGCSSPGPALCAWVADRVKGLEPDAPAPAGLFVLWHAAGNCTDPSVWQWMPLGPGPLFGVVDYVATQDDQWRPVRDPVVPGMVARALGDETHGQRAVQGLASVDNREAAAILLERAVAMPTVEERQAAAVWLYRQSDPEAQFEFAKACTGLPDAWQCVEGDRPLDDLDRAVGSKNTDLTELIDRYPGYRGAILLALERCLRDGVSTGSSQGSRCLSALVGAGEQARALAVLGELEAADVGPLWTPRIEALTRFEGHEGVRAHLVSTGLLPEGVSVLDPREPPTHVAEWLQKSGRALLVPSTSDTERLLTSLLARIPELADAVVVGRRSPVASLVGDPPYVELLVWMDGRRHRALAAEGRADIHQLVGLANTLAAARDLDLRFVAIEPGDLVIWGPEAGLRSLDRDGLIDPMERARPVPAVEPESLGLEEL